MNIDDICTYVVRHPNQWLDTIAAEAKFKTTCTASALIFTLQSNSTRNESFTWMERSLEIYNRTGSLKKRDYPHSQNTSYVLGLFWAVIREGSFLDADISTEEKEIFGAQETEREDLRKSRIGQGKFRSDLLQLRKTCYVTGLAHSNFLRASHIKPWVESNNVERLDCHNGLLLAPNYDLLFDRGFISFSDNGKIMVSPRIPQEVLQTFGVDHQFHGADLGDEFRRYLAFHREEKFRST